VAKVSEARPRLAEVIKIRLGARSPTLHPEPSGPISLAPSDFAFLWDDYPRCFYLKVVRKQGRPRTPFPKVFTTIDRAMKSFYMGQPTATLEIGMPSGLISQSDRWVKSAGLTIPDSAITAEIRGSVDVLIDCDDGSVAVVDFKTTEPSADHIATYSRQLHAYALALEQPAAGRATTVSALGLLCFLPNTFSGTHPASLSGDLKWLAIERDDPSFLRFLIEVVSVIEQPDPPEASPGCIWCHLRDGDRVAS
jgi:hypothetical protein